MSDSIEVFCLDPEFSTTRLLSRYCPKAALVSRSEILHWTGRKNSNEKRIEGGLKGQGYFKYSYERIGGVWYISGSKEEETAEKYVISLEPAVSLKTADSADRSLRLPLITIITVVFNSADLLEGTIRSVMDQTYPNVEYIVIDGNSSDGTLDIIKAYDSLIDYWISEKDSGIFDAMNKGIALASGEIIGILNAGDKYKEYTLNSVNHQFSETGAGFVCGAMNLEEGNGTQLKTVFPKTRLRSINRISAPFPHPSSFIKRAVYQELSVYDSHLKIAADYDFMIRMMNAGVKTAVTKSIFVDFLVGGKCHQTPEWNRLKERLYVWKKNRMGFGILILLIIHFIKVKTLSGGNRSYI